MLDAAWTNRRPRLGFGPIIALPAALWLVIFMLLPLTILFVFSLGTRNNLGQVNLGLSLDNYIRFFSGPYLNTLWRSLILALANTCICLLLGFACAMWLAFVVPRKHQQLCMTLLVAPLWTSFLVRIYAWMTILRPTGILASIIQQFGIPNPPIILYTPLAVLLGMVYNYLPYMILPLYASLEKLDKRLIEAAADLGASPWKSFIRITLPLSLRGIMAGITLVFVPSLGDYVTPDLLGGAKNMFIGNLVQNQFLVVRDWAYGSAVSTILIAIVTLAIWTYLKWGDKQ
ncbi:MAG: ABC transporter permease [Candidatus Melainabacteria bacterium]|nr:ABC transporter permease [Candidatus Melainabacteria bacterium]